MKQVKNDIDIAAQGVEQSENLVLKLERAIIEWSALRKLCQRDSELESIHYSLEGLKESMYLEVDIMQNAMKKLQSRIDNGVDKVGKHDDMNRRILQYISAIKDLDAQVREQMMKRE